MRVSTLTELAGFGLVTYAAYEWHQLVGLLVGGLCLLLIGYATEDAAAGLAVSRLVSPVLSRIARSKVKRQAKKAG